ncbi:MAG: 6-aminohexanoate hydrolase, partial [Mesorhizobium sp.]
MTGKTGFETRYGFARNQVLLGNWRESPFSRWSFQNVGELVPSARVAAASSSSEAPAQDLDGLLGEKVALTVGAETVAAFLTRSDTDALTIMKAGNIFGDWFASHMEFGARHIIFSISKSLTAILAGIL